MPPGTRVEGAASAGAPGGPASQRLHIVRSAYACVARWGLAKTTLDDVAHEARLSRSTLYRCFPGGRDELMDAAVSWEYRRFFGRLYEEIRGAASLEELMERGIVFARRCLREHLVLQKVLATEPEVLLPKLTVEAGRTLDSIADFLVPYIEQHGLAPGVDVDEAADFLARMALSLISSPGRWDMEDPAQVHEVVGVELLTMRQD